jgi:hypothetical protein
MRGDCHAVQPVLPIALSQHPPLREGGVPFVIRRWPAGPIMDRQGRKPTRRPSRPSDPPPAVGPAGDDNDDDDSSFGPMSAGGSAGWMQWAAGGGGGGSGLSLWRSHEGAGGDPPPARARDPAPGGVADPDLHPMEGRKRTRDWPPGPWEEGPGGDGPGSESPFPNDEEDPPTAGEGTEPDLSQMKLPFPWKLHTLLDRARRENQDDIVSWDADGRSFTVHKPREFCEQIMVRYFRQSKLASFIRQVRGCDVRVSICDVRVGTTMMRGRRREVAGLLGPLSLFNFVSLP